MASFGQWLDCGRRPSTASQVHGIAEREVYARSASRVGIYHVSGYRVVGFIEIVSPGNKLFFYGLEIILEEA